MAIVTFFRNVGDKVLHGTCLDADVNPGPTAATYPVGSEFYATNSQKTYVTYDGVNWTQKVMVDPANLNFSNLPTSDPHVAGSPFLDENAKVTVSAG